MKFVTTDWAEDITPGHPDRLADAIVERIVTECIRRDPDAHVTAEAALFRKSCFVTGRLAGRGISEEIIENAVRESYRHAGYIDNWFLDPVVSLDMQCEDLYPNERQARGLSDDQCIVTGYASCRADLGHLPPAVMVARALKDELIALFQDMPERFGPDGKVRVCLGEDGRGRWKAISVHAILVQLQENDYEWQMREMAPRFQKILETFESALPGISHDWIEGFTWNRGNDFTCAGPMGDNGLSGKKLAVDYYGPTIPIGGGAICGKDPHKPDRVGALRARQIALHVVRSLGVNDCRVTLGFRPGDTQPDRLLAQFGPHLCDASDLEALGVRMPDLDTVSTVGELSLLEQDWATVMLRGYFGNNHPWEQAPVPCAKSPKQEPVLPPCPLSTD